MDLILWRHAEAGDADPRHSPEEDLARPLTAKGERHARRAAEWLNRALPQTTRILVSPAVRTQQTAEALQRKFKTVSALGPGGSVEGLLAAARWPDSREPVLVVGHQPTLGLTAAYLMSGQPQAWSIRKGGFWWFKRRQRGEGAETVLVTVRSPEHQ